jgi:hypothetical protein
MADKDEGQLDAKMEKDCSALVDAAIPEAEVLAMVCCLRRGRGSAPASLCGVDNTLHAVSSC